MPISRTKIKSRVSRKTNPQLQETIALAMKSKNEVWHKLAQKLSGSTSAFSSVNLSDLDKDSKAGDTIVIPGKVLGSGALTKKLRIVALSFSESALEKMKDTKSESVSILEEIKKNPKANGIRLLQ